MSSPIISPIITQLKAGGHRLTTARKAIIGIFEANHKPISAEEINVELTAKNININKSTLYREIDFLITQNLLKPIQLQEKTKRYELVHLHHHHHLICQVCKKIEDFELDDCISGTLKQISQAHTFMVNDHILDLYGICENCQKIH
jgi:Fur family transcriptional regulator, ferric uptake regulator